MTPDDAAIKTLAAKLLREDIAEAERIGGGRNSRVYRVSLKSSRKSLVCKVYFRHPQDPRDRLQNEFTALEFLQSLGLDSAPKPVAASPEDGIAIYEYIEGRHPTSAEDIKSGDIEEFGAFLLALNEANRRQKDIFPFDASEAKFSFVDVWGTLSSRLTKLEEIAGEGTSGPYGDLGAFLRADLKPATEFFHQWSRGILARSGVSETEQLNIKERILSPSDFGFHNSLLRSGHWVFIDFEYFGWDDPAKTICDFILHPNPLMSFCHELKSQFVQYMLNNLQDSSLAKRTKALFPIFGLKWCLIILNEFKPRDMQRRQFATLRQESQEVSRGHDEVLQTQLAKAKTMLKRVIDEYDEFPYARI